MLGIKIRDRFLSLYSDTALTFEMVSPAGIISSGEDRIQGGYTTPIDVPLDENNINIIGRIDRLDNNSILLQDEYCEVWVDGVPLFAGKATMKESGPRRASFFMIFNELRDLSGVSMEALYLGGDREIGETGAERVAHANDTLANPLDHDYVFAPVYNPVFNTVSILGIVTEARYQNFWNADTETLGEWPTAVAMPFIRIDYLLSRIFAHQGYTLINEWQTTDELKQLLLWNNRNIYDSGTSWSQTINLSDHVPIRTTTDFVKAITATFALGLFYDHFKKTVLLKPVRDLILAPVTEDWTSKASADFRYVTDKDYIAKWRYDIDTNDELSVMWSGAVIDPNGLLGEGLTARLGTSATILATRYALADNTYYQKATSPELDIAMFGQDYKPVTKEGSDQEYISPLIPLWNSWDIKRTGQYDPAGLAFQEWQHAHIRHPGYDHFASPGVTPLLSFRMMFYRGFQPFDIEIEGTYPMCGMTAYNIRGEEIGSHSLLWDREHGIYVKFWKLVYEMLRSKKTVVRDLRLSITDLLNFEFKNKYRIENQNVFFTRLRFSVSHAGLGIVEATYITTL